MRTAEYTCMNGLGNRFIIIDGRQQTIKLSTEQVCLLSDEKHPETKGCDQLVVLEPSDTYSCFMRIYNADGGEVEACGNVTRCAAWLLAQERGNTDIVINTQAGALKASVSLGGTSVSVDMGKPRLQWNEIPLAEEVDTLHLPVQVAGFSDPVAVNMGNPHMVFFVDDVENIDFIQNNLGKTLEEHALYPQKANVGMMQVIDRNTIRLRVFERGVGETLACGTGACAAAVAAMRRGVVERNVTVRLNGGNLQVTWDENDHVHMVGETQFERSGMVAL